MTCDELEPLLLEYAEGALDEPRARAAAEHLAGCPVCSARLASMRDLLRDLGAARSLESAPRATVSAAPAAPRPPVAPPAQRLPRTLDDFELLAELGRGGMGIVYRARQMSLNRIVALKLLSLGGPGSERAVQRFQKEAKAAARLHHTNIVPIYAQGRADDCVYYAMELIDGQPLSDVLVHDPTLSPIGPAARAAPTILLPADPAATLTLPPAAARTNGHGGGSSATAAIEPDGHATHQSTSGGRRDYRRIARLLAEVADALAHAHHQGVIHRDIKPQNLLLGRDDRLHVVDFGLARLLDEPGMTLTTELVGTPSYMSPEQLGPGSRGVDHRTDIYSLGVTLYELLTRRRPFEGRTYDQIVHQVLRREPARPRSLDPHIPRDLETICLRAMEKERGRRFQAAEELARDLRRFADGAPIHSRRIGLAGRLVRWVRRRPVEASLIATAAALVVLVPTLLGVSRAYANGRIDAAYNVLLDDYRDTERARAALGWADWLPGDAYRRGLLDVLATIIGEPEAARDRALRLVERYPQSADARYLLAWACVRCMKARGDELWSQSRQQLRAGDDAKSSATAAGYFYKGLALISDAPKEAEPAFAQAVAQRLNFVQAMQHQARAMNQILYHDRDITYYQKARSCLEYVIVGQAGKAYPRYLLALTHQLAAEIFAKMGNAAAAEQAFADCLNAARDAQRVDPTSARGLAAEAGYHESRGDYAAALDAWNRTRQPPVKLATAEAVERAEYTMRLCFWLGEFDRAEACRVERAQLSPHPDPADVLYAAVIALSAGRPEAARAAMEQASARAAPGGETALFVASVRRLAGLPWQPLEPPRLDRDPADLSPHWDGPWLAALYRYWNGDISLESLIERAQQTTGGDHRRKLWLAGAYYYAGVRALVEGRRAEAERHLSDACALYDFERYCFRARFLLERLRRSSGWPEWLAEGRRATP